MLVIEKPDDERAQADGVLIVVIIYIASGDEAV